MSWFYHSLKAAILFVRDLDRHNELTSNPLVNGSAEAFIQAI